MKLAATATALILILCLLLMPSCRKTDPRTVTIDVPGMKNEACVKIVVDAVNRTPGVFGDKTRIDWSGRTVTVTYESLNLSLKNIEFAIAEAGFQADEVPANPQAADALPPECK